MRTVRIITSALLAFTLVGCGQQVSTTSDGKPVPPMNPGQAKGFSNRAWFGKDQPTDVDPILSRRNFLIVLDGSGSMADVDHSGGLPKLTAARNAIKAFIGKLRPDDNVGLCAFDSGGVSMRSSLSIDRAGFNSALDAIRADSGTPLGPAINLGYASLQKQGARQLGYGEYYLVVVTDGEANEGVDPGRVVDKIVAESPVIISTVGFNIGQGHSLHRPGLTLYHDATNLKELNDGLESVLAESEAFKDAASFH